MRGPVLELLESLRLNWTRLGPDALPLVGSPKLARLRRLDLSQNDLDAKAVRALAESPHLAGLCDLNLERNPIGDAGAVALAESPHLRNLLVVNLMFCEVGDAGAQAFLDSPLAETLVRLRLFSPGKALGAAMKRKLRKRFGERVSV